MERLTKTLEERGEKFACLPDCKDGCIYGWGEEEAGCRCDKFTEILCRLAKIEDILGDDYDLDRLRELVEADRDGRCVVLPGKAMGEVYALHDFIGRPVFVIRGAVGAELKGEQDG